MARWLRFWWGLLAAMPSWAAEPGEVWQAIADAVTPTPDLQVRVRWVAPGYSAEDLETVVAAPGTRALASLPGLQSVVSMNVEGETRLALTLKADPLVGFRGVVEALRALRSLPPEVMLPLIEREGGARVALLAVPDRSSALRLRTQLDRTPGVGRVALCGAEAPVIEVEVDTRRLPAEVGGGPGVVRALGATPSADLEALGALRLNAKTRLSDVARIQQAPPSGCRCLAAGARAVCLEVWSQAGARPPWQAAVSEVANALPAGSLRQMAGGDREEAWGWLADEASGRLLEGAVAKVAPDAWLQVWPDRFRVWVPAGVGPALWAALGAVTGVEREGDRRPGEATTTVWVTQGSGDTEALEAAAAGLATFLRAQGARAARTGPARARPEVDVVLDREQTARLGLATADVAQAARLALHGVEVSRPGAAPVVQIFVDRVSTPEALAELSLVGRDGRRVPLGSVARIVSKPAPSARWGLDGRRARPVRVSGLDAAALAEALAKAPLAKGVAVAVGPDADLLLDAHR